MAGSQLSCIHYDHCRKSTFIYPNIVLDFRYYIYSRLGLPIQVTRTISTDTTPRVLIVQRQSFRLIENVLVIKEAMEKVIRASINIVDLELLGTLDAQITLISQTDILVLVHGGALAYLPYLPERAMVIDIYPYSYLPELNGIVNWIRYNTKGLNISHEPFEVTKPDYMKYLYNEFDHPERVYLVPLPVCLCNTTTRESWKKCSVHMFNNVKYVFLEFDIFLPHFARSIFKWKLDLGYVEPLERHLFELRVKQIREPWYYSTIQASLVDEVVIGDCFRLLS